MKISTKLAVALAAACCSCLFSPSEAAKIDVYRDMLLSQNYTIRYDNITPPKRQTNRDKLPLFGNSGMAVEKNDYLTNRQRSGVIVSDGTSRYEEVGSGAFSQCRLYKGKSAYNFTKYPKKDDPRLFDYMGNKKNKVAAVERNYLAEAVSGESYGDADTTRLINAMLPNDKKAAESMVYTLAGAGSLPNGLTYEDYKGSLGGVTSIIRYYFDGDTLTKIAAAEYYRNSSGNIEGTKHIIKIKEFSPTPDRTLLKLPEGLEDVTKR